MEKKICIVHYNTPALTTCLIKSINKYTPGTTIYVFDNSDKKPFKNIFDNVIVFDNTKGQIINFDEWLKKYPDRKKSAGAVNNFGSAKHCYTIQKCIELIDENFVLLDSDILLRKDISGIWDGRYVWVGGVEKWSAHLNRKRACPFLLYLNVEKMKEKNITFFSDTHMFGLKNGNRCEEYDTGCWLYEQTGEKSRRVIKYQEYITHFRAGSWLDDARKKHHYKQMDPKKWLIVHKKYWLGNNEALSSNWYETFEKGPQATQVIVKREEKPKQTLNLNFGSVFDHIYCLHYLPDSDRLPKLKSEFKRVGIDENADYFSWVYDYPSPLLDLVFEDERLNISLPIRSSGRPHIKRSALKHYEIAKDAYENGYERILVLEDDVRFHNDVNYISNMLMNMPDTDIVMFDKMVSSSPGENTKYAERVRELGKDALYGNMDGIFFIFASCYSLNRNGMKHIIEKNESSLLPPDTPFNDQEISGSFAIVNLAIQDPALKKRKIESYDKIWLDVSAYGGNEKESEPEPAQTIPASDKPKSTVTVKAVRKSNKKILINKPSKPVRYEVVKPVSRSITPKPKTPIQNKIIKQPRTKIVHTRIVHANSKNYNKLYDI